MQTEMKVNVSTYPEIRNWAKSKLGNRGPGERLSWGKRDKGQRKARTCVASLRAQVAAARAEKCECARPHALKAASAAGGSPPPPAAWPTGQALGKGTGGPGLGGGVRMSRPPTHTSLEGRGRRAHPCLLSHLPFVTASHSSSPRPQPTRHPSPAGTLRRARSRHRAPHLPAAGRLVSSAWSVTLLDVHIHLQTQPCAHACAHRSTCTPHTPRVHTCLCARKQPTDVHTHVCPHMHASVLTPALVTALAFRPQPGACPPAGLRPPQHPPWAHPNPVFLPPRPWRVFLCHCWCCRLWVGPWCPGRLCGLWCLGQRGARLSARG